ncbi:extracellular solute-binding protein [Streptomyces sp. ISL-10]|uniref:extracellular solute-binding protein n=1 Tax=Streptomyces sp. ISL-10 TaxID=2819172 RepID=UPI001BEA3AD5|nr:extracellular solute-binding protein [Streptomyces sp. ISL-10]MBT2364698.1 extracellular solute-binding protein [Streptomyces sp. ISL-10]
MKRLRLALAGCLLAVSAVSAGGCTSAAPDERTLVVLGPWTDGEETPFVQALKSIGRKTGHRYVYKGTRSLRETLVAQLQAGAPPDLAILNSPGELAQYARSGDAHPLPERVAGAAIPPWAPPVTVAGKGGAARTHVFWAPVRVDLKSLVWSRTDVPEDADPEWCLGLNSGATSGWPGTDWIEDLMLQRGGPVEYENWATGKTSWKSTRPVWEEWARTLSGSGRSPAPDALTDSFELLDDGRYGLLNRGDCTHEHQGSFIRRHYGDDVRPSPTARHLDPVVSAEDGGGRNFEVSGDMAAVFRPSAAAWDLLDRLTSAPARKDWADAAKPGERPFFPGGTFASKPPSQGTRAVQELFDSAHQICLDASDAMPPTLRDAFYRAVLEFVGDPKDPALLTRLLERLDAETALQREKEEEEEGAFVLDDLCDNPVSGAAGAS